MRNINECQFVMVLLCADCRTELNRTIQLSADELTKLNTLSSAFAAGKCPNGCRSTFSDLNINTELVIHDAETGIEVERHTFNYLQGHFYSDDYDKVCDCEPDDTEVYFSDKYPPVHGRCGRWLEPYRSKL